MPRGRPRQPPPIGPCVAQGLLLGRFERAYFASGKKHTLDTLGADFAEKRADHPFFAGQRAVKEQFSRSTYNSWKAQDASPRLCDAEVLCQVLGQRLTLVLDPNLSNYSAGEHVDKTEAAMDSITSDLRELPPEERWMLLGELRRMVQEARLRSPLEANASEGPARVRK